ncbi:MarR family winged helix-turn-helix transcriptional regulator [Rathayibacter sp. CAU 1779]
MTTLPTAAESVKGLTKFSSRHKPLGDLMREAQRTLVLHLEQALRDNGYDDVGVPHVSLLSLVEPDGSRLAVLTQCGGRTKQASAELAAHLVKRGYLSLAPDPSDGRAKLYRLTPSGERLLNTGVTIVSDYEQWLDRVLGAGGVDHLRTALTTIIAHR